MVNSDTTTNGRNIEMSAVGSSSIKDQSKATFWKKNAQSVPGSIKPVYGAQHPPRQEPILGASHMAQGTPRKDRTRTMKDSFQDFQDNTKDAWDDGDDDLILMANVRLSRKDVHNTAMQVLENHSQQMREAAARGVTLRPSLSESLDDGSTHQHHSHSSNSAPSTPSHLSGHRGNGPGLGVRLNTHWKVPKTNPLTSGQLPIPDRESSKIEKFKSLFEASAVTIEELRKISWSGIPVRYRPTTWKILSGYLPANTERRELTLRRKRQEYYGFLEHYYDKRKQDFHQETFRQISIDIPRMSPLIALFQQDTVQRIFERILYIWAIRHPASGYVQGINDLVTPFFVVFLTEYMNPAEKEVDTFEVASLPEASIRQLEADSFWCFSKLLDGIQDNYTFAQPGIQTKVHALQELVSRIDSKLHTHLEEQHVEYLQFSFRWMNNLLMREIPLHCIIRLWDTYLSETDGFALFHLYVCAAFLTHFSQDLKREHDFQGLMLMLQSLPTHSWHNEEIGLLLAEAFKLKFMFADAPKHLDHKK